MRFLALIGFLLFSLTVSAKKAPKWKGKHFKTSSAGIRYDIRKRGTGDSIQTGYGVHCFFYEYNYKTKKYDPVLSPSKLAMDPERGCFISFEYADYGENSFMPALRMLRKGGEGYFIVPQKGTDSACYYIRVTDVFRLAEITIPKDTAQKDSVNIVVTDPNQKYFGDTLFTMMKLLEAPQVGSCGITKVNVAYKFEMTWFDHGVQRKNILVFIECPQETYGKDFFEAGKSYVVTCVPMTEDFKQNHHTMNNYPLEKLDVYYGLRIKKAAGSQ